jgi:hydroxymethylpyrimidine/phosphomethylpyrimidine kinase
MDPKDVRCQIDAVLEDGPVCAVKSGMLATPETVAELARALRERCSGVPYVLDPVLAASAGQQLAGKDLAESLVDDLLPLADLCTPNLQEAQLLSGVSTHDREGMLEAARELLRLGCGAVLVTGGHMQGDPADVLVAQDRVTWFSGGRIGFSDVHGTGCTLASAVASLLGVGYDTARAVSLARSYVRVVIRGSIERAGGRLPGHFPRLLFPPISKGSEQAFYMPPRFCPACGSELRQEPLRKAVCPECGSRFYRNPLPAVAIVVRKGTRALLVRRAQPPAVGALCLPGGFMELDETVMECGSRELFEETSLVCDDFLVLGTETERTIHGGVVLMGLEALEWQGSPRAGDDASDTVWAEMSQIPELAFAAHRKILQRAAERLDSRERDSVALDEESDQPDMRKE